MVFRLEQPMRRGKVPWILIFTAGVSLRAVPVQAQTEIGIDLGLMTSYVWRGLTLTNKPVVQPAVYVSFPVGNASITAGAWSSIDLGKYDDPTDDISLSGGSSGFNLAELEPYAEVSIPAGKATVTGGVVGYVYPNSADAPGFGRRTSDANTLEIYGKLGWDALLSPELSVYYDLDKIKGAYIEGGLSYSLAASDQTSVDLGALAGFNAGRVVRDDPRELANYSDDGFTHLDLSAAIPFTTGSLSITPAVHLVVTGDEFTKVTSPANQSDLKLWGGVSIGWSRALGPVPEEENP
jgi:hypothetical protein